jgi:hypothetical protein
VAHDEIVGLTRADARVVIARQYGFTNWPKLAEYVDSA